MIRRVGFRAEAREEIALAHDWFEEQRTGLGDEFLDDLRESLKMIESDADLYAVLYREIRAKPLRRFPYIVYFRTSADRVDVIAVQHAHRNPDRWKSRS